MVDKNWVNALRKFLEGMKNGLYPFWSHKLSSWAFSLLPKYLNIKDKEMMTFFSKLNPYILFINSHFLYANKRYYT